MRVALLAVVAFLVAAAPARADVVYVRGLSKLSVYIAGDDGHGARRLITGDQPRLAPDGTAVVFVANAAAGSPELREIPAAGGKSKLLLKPWRFGAFAWSPDGRYIAAQSGPLNGKQKLVLIDRASGATRTVAAGYFSGTSFSPASDMLVYGRADEFDLFAPSNLEIAPVAGGAPTALTSDGHGGYPLWGPRTIAYTRWAKPAKRGDGPKFNLSLINADGTGARELTHDKVPFLLTGLTAVDWSADGSRLLAQFGGQDTTYCVTVDPANGKERVVGTKSQGCIPYALSADGRTMLGSSGGFEWPGPARIVTASYTGTRTKVLIAHGQSPDWNR
jgi:Tol biopolymer transport system component